MKNLAKKYRLPETTTTEMLQMGGGTVINFGNKVILAGYNYTGKYEPEYFAAVYEYTTKNHSIEAEIRLTAVSDRQFEDNGHAIAWGMQY